MTSIARRLFLPAAIALTCIALGTAGWVPVSAGPIVGQEPAGAEDVGRISVDELILLLAKKAPIVVIDVRGKDSYDSRIKGALQIPLSEIADRLKEIPKDKDIITYCA